MSYLRRVGIAVCVLALVCTVHAWSQAPERPGGMGMGMPPVGGPSRQAPQGPRAEELRHLMETIRMVRLTRELGLNDEQTVLVVRRIEDLKQRERELARRKEEVMRELRESVRAGAPDERIQDLLNEAINVDREMAEIKIHAVNEFGDLLSPTQRAKLYLFTSDFNKDMRNMIERARRLRIEGMGDKQPGKQAPGMPGSPPARERVLRSLREGERPADQPFRRRLPRPMPERQNTNGPTPAPAPPGE
jgi:Spy/CpxP family protein refolding chaperone